VHPDDRLPVQDAVRNAVENLGRYEIEYRTLRRDGSLYWTAARGQVFADSLGRPLRMAGVCMDISDQKRTQELLIQTEKLAAAGRLAATVAHEINNPLESVVNLLYLTQLDESLSATARQYLTAADRELERVSLIARQTLGFYRGATRREEVGLSELLDSIVAVYGRKLSDKSIVVEKRYRPGCMSSVFAGEVRQLLANLVANAADAMPNAGRLVLKIRKSRAWKDSGPPGLRVTVADTGCGIAATELHRIFEPFYSTKKDVGTGLGLWVCMNIVQRHGGSIRVRSRRTPARSGSVFSIFLPAVAEAVSQPQLRSATTIC
jgi:signal transduction histidine kinase